MGNSPPDATKKGNEKSPVTNNASVPSIELPADAKASDTAAKIEPPTNVETTQPLAPPPRPAPQVSNTPDYFSAAHGHLSFEPNPFEQSFGGSGSVETPGGTKLPSVAALTSPASLLPGGGNTPFNWAGSLRTGPLSPAMLSGPAGDYFGDGHHLRAAFPTPNESSLRTGMTPGGSGSMFPAASPNSQALFNQLASGGATPGTLDFHRSAMVASTNQKQAQLAQHNKVTSQPAEQSSSMDVKAPPPQNSDPFGQHDANDAANGLYLLAQARNGNGTSNNYQLAQSQPVHAHPQSIPHANQSVETSPNLANRQANGSIGTNMSGSARGVSEMSGASDENEQRPNTRGKGKRGSSVSTAPASNGRKRADETPTKAPASKKSKGNNGSAMSAMEPEPPSDEEPDMSKDEYNANGRKMTDEEKRKNFLERNRVAALKCRQRKKQWLANLQQKVEMFSQENDVLSTQVSQLRDEIVQLKTLLLGHKDCPISQAQGLQHMNMGSVMDGYGQQQMNPYGMAGGMQHQQPVMAGQGMPRRYS